MNTSAEPTRLFDFVDHQRQHYPSNRALSDLFEGKTRTYSTEQIQRISNQIARGLLKQGLQPGDKVAMVTYRNRIEFTLLDLGIQKAGLVSVPLYPTISPREYEYILNDAQVKIVFYGAQDLEEKLGKAQPHVPSIEKMFALDENSQRPYWEQIWIDEDGGSIGTEIRESTLATIIYTSGTTGQPKGVMLTHHNIVQNVIQVKSIIPLEPGDRVMSFLPLCHIFERSASFAYLYMGLEVTYTALDNLGGEKGDLKQVMPHFMTCVPRLLEKIYEKIYQKGSGLSGVKKRLFFWALHLTEDYSYDKTYSGFELLKRKVADRLIFSKWRAALGGCVKGIITGSAPCPERLAQVFSAAGIPIREGYGLTESSPGITINRFERGYAKLGTVGPTLDNVEVRIDDGDGHYNKGEGEVLASGPNIMQGYYNKPEETALVLQKIDGKIWLRTGDIGTMITADNGVQFLKITDRKKELLKTSGGKYVAPAPIENKLKEHILIEHAMVVGDGRRFVSAIIVPAEEPLKTYCQENQIPWKTFSSMLTKSEIYDRFNHIVEKANHQFARYEQIKKFCLISDTWVPIKENGAEGELTPTLKLKRRILLAKYAREIDDLYDIKP